MNIHDWHERRLAECPEYAKAYAEVLAEEGGEPDEIDAIKQRIAGIIDRSRPPYGFTREDVEDVRNAATEFRGKNQRRLLDIAARIEALLSPKEQA